jgi:hypothetical protein
MLAMRDSTSAWPVGRSGNDQVPELQERQDPTGRQYRSHLPEVRSVVLMTLTVEAFDYHYYSCTGSGTNQISISFFGEEVCSVISSREVDPEYIFEKFKALIFQHAADAIVKEFSHE